MQVKPPERAAASVSPRRMAISARLAPRPIWRMTMMPSRQAAMAGLPEQAGVSGESSRQDWTPEGSLARKFST